MTSTALDITSLLATGETETLEFKSSFDREAIETLAAFANASGGTVLVGIADDKTVRGVQLGKETLNEWLSQVRSSTAPSIIPDIKVIKHSQKTIVALTMPSFPVKPVSCKGKYYKRVASSNQQLSLSQIAAMYMQSLQISWDSYPDERAGLDDLDVARIEAFISEVNTSGRFQLDASPLAALEKLRLVHGVTPTHAAMLLFAYVPLDYHIRVGRFKNEVTILDDRRITAQLFTAVDETMRFVQSHLSLGYQFDGSVKRIETWEYPLSALREAVLNAVVHRDYAQPSDIQIKIFDDRITIYSPGALYGDLTIEKLMRNVYQSNPRNKLTAEAFYLTRRIEKYGSGISRIRQELASYPHLAFTIEEVANGILVSFVKRQSAVRAPGEQPEVTGEVAGEVTGEVTGEVMRLLNVCDGERSRMELQQLLGLKHEEHFRTAYLLPAMQLGFVEMTRPERPKSRLQRYRLSGKGRDILASLSASPDTTGTAL